jgi:hypothetical protein
MRSTWLRRGIAGGALWLGCSAAPAVAEAAPSAEQRTAAEALFQQGRELMTQKSFAAACEKFAASQELDPGLGTQLHLADCYDLAGKTASAWALFKEVATAARRAGEQDRKHIAEERAENLALRLSKLELHVAPNHVVPGLELVLNDVVIPRASWNTALPLDPGPVHIEARAPGKKPWHYHGAVDEGPASRSVEVPQLRDTPRSGGAPASSPPVAPVKLENPGSAQRAIGYFVSATGVVALAVGAAFGYRAYALNQQSKGQCRADDANACTSEGVTLRDDAQRMAAASTIVSIAGGVLTVGGATLVLSAPSAKHLEQKPRQSAGLELFVHSTW